jgi:hypothetical protein
MLWLTQAVYRRTLIVVWPRQAVGTIRGVTHRGIDKEISTMPVYEEDPLVERRVVRDTNVVRDTDDGSMTSYAFVKYAFILAITIVILYFIARVLLPAFGA